ncbi:MAG: sugar transferase [Actinomycetales bacterium]|nr:sugar transferase [Actinomycetales bacterium]
MSWAGALPGSARLAARTVCVMSSLRKPSAWVRHVPTRSTPTLSGVPGSTLPGPTLPGPTLPGPPLPALPEFVSTVPITFPVTDLPVPLSEPHRLVSSRAKRLLDVLGAFLLLGFLVMTLPLLALAIKLDSRGPVFHIQQRVGLHGAVFTMYKLRSMTCGAEADGQACWTYRGDPRVTRLGRLLRASHLDELPQALNIIRGEMSLVGPRPERPEIVLDLRQQLAAFDLRHTVRPGLTGQAQIKHCYTSSLGDWHGKLAHDLDYIRMGTLRTDLQIILGTLAHLVRLKGL